MMYREIGNVIKPHGLKGEVVVLMDAVAASRIQDISALYIEIHGTKVPYVIEGFSSLRPGQYKLKLSNINSLELAEQLRKQPCYCIQEEIPEEEDADLAGYTLKDKGVRIGEILSTVENTLQVLLEVQTDGGELFIPLTTDWIIQLDEESKVLNMDLPDGLLDI